MDRQPSSSTEVVVVEEEAISLSKPIEETEIAKEVDVVRIQLTTEELIAKSIAPVKTQYLRPPPQRSDAVDNVDGGNKKSVSSNVTKEKKSKRQMKRERQQEQKSALHICPAVAKSGNVGACRYGLKCRYSHDLEAYKVQKPADIEGTCPFLNYEGPCPYGLACRFSSTHRLEVPADPSEFREKSSEVNGLKKDVQKLLWKNKMSFPKADDQLKVLGLLNKSKTKDVEVKEKAGDEPVLNGSCAECEVIDPEVEVIDLEVDVSMKECCPEVPVEEGILDNALAVDHPQPSKKAKIAVINKCGSNEKDNGLDPLKEGSQDIHAQTEVQVSPTDTYYSEADKSLKIHPREKKLVDFRGKLYLAPLTTVGNLPFRRVCKTLGADITCGEMAMCTNLLQGQASEWALLRRHSSEDLFGVQICGAYPDTVARAVELIDRECQVDFIDINMGCPIDIVVNKGAGSSLLTKPMRIKNIIQSASATVDKPVTVKVRTGYFEGRNRIDSLISDISHWGASAVTIHGRSRQQRYSKLADWDYIYQCARKAPDTLQVLGNGDVFSYLDWNKHTSECPELSACMIARGSLIKPWLFTEIKEQRHWDISSGERLNILKDFSRFGLEHWGSDTKGVETTRHFLLEWLSYAYRYIPVGLLDVIPQRLNWRQPSYCGRNDLETLMASDSAADWVKISELLLGKVPEGFTFAPKHKSNAYDKAENG
ncbi:tRNA-dihydrouridine(47) synthase [NAD(P)(+)]-like [Thalictrum thalictroides]|uniref:tRNA-dihydrouridine(47) synthase [NAD(P)(+)] n=1 Tax=Thalictrum thalictroides TaxID=46969 RepID=A0A7J6VZX6_THATH|nr:tRNA-dihydrouridine(47) synthase [NAD(P)(+)]-like [Thalictrum thalictroides]